MNVATEETEDALMCSGEGLVKSQDMDFGSSFNAIPCKEVMKDFKSYSGKVRLAYRRVVDESS